MSVELQNLSIKSKVMEYTNYLLLITLELSMSVELPDLSKESKVME